jgi:hypothetical protein
LHADAKKAIVEVVEEEETVPMPEYTSAETEKLLLYIQQIVTPYDLTDDEINDSFTECTKKWLFDVMETFLFVYFDNGYLSASAMIPASPASQLTYFIREQLGHVFTLDGFHDEIAFGTIHENIDETILTLMNCFYIPKILNDTRWNEKVKQSLYNEMHSFMAYLTDISRLQYYSHTTCTRHKNLI